MAEEELYSPDDMQATADTSSGVSDMTYTAFMEMEELLDKLKLLNYDNEFVKGLKMKPLNRHYFAIQTNPGEQFYLFTSLAAWLIRKAGNPFEQPQEYDDPNSTISSILDSVRKMGVAVDFPPSKLKQGFGEHAIFVLNHLADPALKATNFTFQMPEYPTELEPEDDIIDDDSELILERVEEEMAADYSDEEEETVLRIEDLQNLRVGNKGFSEQQKSEVMLESTTNMDNWKLELERVLPQLKITVKADAKDWRAHLEQMQQYRSGIEEALGSTRTNLNKLQADISHTLDKITNREKYLNQQLEPHLAQNRTLQEEYSKLNGHYQELNVGVTEKTRTLARHTEELESVKQEMEERGSSMTDGTPLVSIKKSLAQIKNEITTMDVCISLTEHSLMQKRLKDKTQLQQDMNSSVPQPAY